MNADADGFKAGVDALLVKLSHLCLNLDGGVGSMIGATRKQGHD